MFGWGEMIEGERKQGRGVFGWGQGGCGEKMGVGEFSPQVHHLKGKNFLLNLGRKLDRKVERK